MKTNTNQFLGLANQLILAVAVTGFALLGNSARAATGFEGYKNFPLPAAGAFVVSGTAAPDGRLILWDGETVFRQFDVNTDSFPRIAWGYQGDTAFVALSPDGRTLLLGQGFAGNLYRMDLNAPRGFTPESVVANIPGHFAGVFLSDNLLLLDVGRLDFSGSELQIINLSAAKSTPKLGVGKGPAYMKSGQKDLVVDKPTFSYSSSLAVDTINGRVYAMDANTRELRSFSIAALINAFNTNTALDWATDGTLIGTAGQFYSGGVAGVRADGRLVIGGSEGFLLPGGIQIVDPSLANPANATVVQTLDPAGTAEFYYVIYNAYTDVISGLTFSGEAFLPENLAQDVPVAGGLGLLLLVGGLGAAGGLRLRK